jgi:von Willebrand factor type A domain/HYDIN/CFA65/VesB-like, Ig-like domain/Cep192 domain 4
MPRVVVAGSENEFHFAVIDFTNPLSPSVKLVTPTGFAGGCRVAIAGASAVVGDVLGGKVQMVNVTNPAAPALQGSVSTVLGGIGAIAISGSLVAVGESANNFQARVMLLDFSNPMAPTIVGTAPTPLISMGGAAISSIAFLSNNVVQASGSDFEIVQVDFTNPASPVVTTFNPTLAGPPVIDVDGGANRLVAGDSTSGIMKLFNATSKTLITNVNTTMISVNSASLANPVALAASQNEFNARKVDFSGPTVTSFNPGLGGGSVTAIEATIGACGAILGSDVALMDLSGAPSVMGTANSTLASISTLAMSTPAAGPAASLSVTSLAFGVVRVGTPATLPVTIKNTGGSALHVTNLASSNPRFTFSPAGPFTIAGGGGTQVVNVTFTPNLESPPPYSGNLTMNTDDPAHGTLTVGLSGTGGLPHISVSPLSLNLGSVAVCLSAGLPVNIHNTGAIALTVSSVTTTGAPYSVSPANLTVGPGATIPVTVTFAPAAVGAAPTGTLSIHSDDAANPVVNVSLNGTGLPTPPPSISVSPASLVFGLVPVQFFIGLRITVANNGPCQPLNVTLTTSGAPYFVTDVDPTTLPPSSTSVPSVVLHNTSKRFVVVFAPTATGAVPGTLTITSNDPANPSVTVPLSGTGVQLNPASLELVLDRSGSMAAAAQGGSKMDGLKAAVHLFADLLIPGQGDEMGSVQFDDAFNVLTPFGTFDSAKQSAIKSDADTLTPRNATSIGGGLQLGQTQVSAGTATRKILLVFTDGLQNTPPDINAVEPGILAAGTEVYAIGLGQPQNISTADLSTLAASSNGHFFLTDDTLILRKNFVQVLADAFRQNMAADPVFNVAAGTTRKIPVAITECERRISFVLNWDNPASIVDLAARAPDGTLFNAASAGSNQLVRFRAHPGYRLLQIAFPPVDPGSGLVIGPPQLGTWTMEVTGSALAGASERCTTSVVVESQLELRGIVQAVDTTQPIQVKAVILKSGAVVTNAEVTVTVTAPQKSLAAVSTPAVIKAARNADTNPIPAGLKPRIPVKKTTYKFTKPNEREFSLKIPPPRVDGVYTFEFQARGRACGGIFDRYRTFSVYIGLKPSRKGTTVGTSAQGPLGAVVTVTPRTSAGVAVGPGRTDLLKIKMRGGMIGPFVDLGNGSYAARVSWSPRTRTPALNLTVGDFTIPVKLPTSPTSPAVTKATKKKKR